MSIAEKLTMIAENEQKVYDAGFKAGQATGGGDIRYDEFWDSCQDNGNRKAYRHGFAGKSWTDTTFKPKYDIIPDPYGALYLFAQSRVTDLKQTLLDCGVTLDLSEVINGLSLFDSAELLTHLPALDLSACTSLTSAFKDCKALESVVFTGVVKTGIMLSDSPLLSHDSIISLFNALQDGGSGTVTLGETNLAKLTDAEKAIATEKGWTLV